MDLTEKEIGMLRRIVTDDAFELLERIGGNLIANWNSGALPKETEWEAASTAVQREARKTALTAYLETLKQLANGSK